MKRLLGSILIAILLAPSVLMAFSECDEAALDRWRNPVKNVLCWFEIVMQDEQINDWGTN